MFSCMMVGEHCWVGGGCCLWYFHYLSLAPVLCFFVTVHEFVYDCLISLSLSAVLIPSYITTNTFIITTFSETPNNVFFSPSCYLHHNTITCTHLHTSSRLLARSQPTFLNKLCRLGLIDSPVTICGTQHPFVASCLHLSKLCSYHQVV